MNFDVFYELSVPDFTSKNEHQVYSDTLDELILADRLGFKTAWLVEHHFSREYSHSSAPDLILAAASQRTNHIRLGLAITPLPYHHPIQTAERLATLDILCNGRVEFGFGRGFLPQEYEVFNQTIANSKELTREALEIILLAFKPGAFSYQGNQYKIDQIDVLPKPIQQPHPPLWTAAISPETFSMAAKMRLGVLAGPFKPWFMIKEDIRRYQQAWHEHQHLSLPQSAMTIGIFCLDDSKTAHRYAKPGFEWFYQQLFKQTLPILEKLYTSYEYYRRLGKWRGLLQHSANLSILEKLGMVIVGDPSHCHEQLIKLEKNGVDRVLCAFGAGVLPTDLIKTSMALFAEEVMPLFNKQAIPA